MITTYFRSSYLNNLDFCEMQTFLNYNLGIERKAGLKAAKGTTVHKVLECLALLKLESDKAVNVKGIEFGIDDKAVGKFSITKGDLFAKSTVDSLVSKAFDHYSLVEGNNFSKKDFLDIEEWVYTVLWYKDGIFDPRKRTIVAAEPHFDITIQKPWAAYKYDIEGEKIEGQLAIKGTIDLVTQLDDNSLEIIDWKTGQRKNWATGEQKTYEKLCQDPQLMLYYYAARQMYPWAKNIALTIYFIRDGGPFTMCFDDETIEQVEDHLEKKFKYVKKIKVPRMVSITQTDFRCTRICDYFKKNWEGTNINQCRFIHDKIKKHGIDYVQANFKNPEHNVDFYQNPGE